MKLDAQSDYIEEIISSAKRVAIICGVRGNDGMGAALALAAYIEEKTGLSTTLVYTGDVSTIRSDFFELHDVVTDVEPKTLKVTIDYQGTGAESVDYYPENGAMVLEIKPVKRDFDTSHVKYEFSGGTYDVIVTVGIPSLDALKDKTSLTDEDLAGASLINIDTDQENSSFGKLNMVNPQSDSLCALVFGKFAKWKYAPSQDASKALLLGLSG